MEHFTHTRRKRTGTDRNFAKQYHVAIDRVWGYLSPTAQAIYPVLERFANVHTRCTGASQSYIGRVARRRKPIRQEHVSKAITELEGWGLVAKKWTARGLLYYLPREAEIMAFLIQRDGVRLGCEQAGQDYEGSIYEVAEVAEALRGIK